MVLEVLEACSVGAAPLTRDPDRPAMGQTFMDLDPMHPPPAGDVSRADQLTAATPVADGGDTAHRKLNVTRGEWLRSMPERDLLSNDTDRSFEGMGKLGNATDLAALAEAAGAELAALMHDAHDAHAEPAEPADGHAGGAAGPAPADGAAGPAAGPPAARAEAPLFELRGGAEMFGVAKKATPDQWLPEANAIFTKVHAANGGRVYEPGPAPLDRAPAPKVTNPHLWDEAPAAAAPDPAAAGPVLTRIERPRRPERARGMADVLLRLFCCR
jgi:hypothetical protein